MIPCLPAPTKAAALVSGRSFVIRTFSDVARTVGRMASDTSSDTNGKCRMPKRNRKYTRKAHTVMAPKRLARVIVKRWSQPPSLWTGRLAISNPNSKSRSVALPPPSSFSHSPLVSHTLVGITSTLPRPKRSHIPHACDPRLFQLARAPNVTKQLD